MATFTFRKNHGSANRTNITREQCEAVVASQAPPVQEQVEVQPENSEETFSAPVEPEATEEELKAEAAGTAEAPPAEPPVQAKKGRKK